MIVVCAAIDGSTTHYIDTGLVVFTSKLGSTSLGMGQVDVLLEIELIMVGRGRDYRNNIAILVFALSGWVNRGRAGVPSFSWGPVTSSRAGGAIRLRKREYPPMRN